MGVRVSTPGGTRRLRLITGTGRISGGGCPPTAGGDFGLRSPRLQGLDAAVRSGRPLLAASVSSISPTDDAALGSDMAAPTA